MAIPLLLYSYHIVHQRCHSSPVSPWRLHHSPITVPCVTYQVLHLIQFRHCCSTCQRDVSYRKMTSSSSSSGDDQGNQTNANSKCRDNICLFKFLVLTLFWRLPSNIFRMFVFVTYNRFEPLYSSALIISSHQRGARSMGPTRIAQMNDRLKCNKLLPGDADDEGGGSRAKNKTKAAFDKGQYFLSRQKRYQMPTNAQYHEYTEQRRRNEWAEKAMALGGCLFCDLQHVPKNVIRWLQ